MLPKPPTASMVYGLCFAVESCIQAAIQLEGIASYEVFPNPGATNGGSVIRESFHARVEGEKWLVTTRLLSSEPSITSPSLTWPLSQEAGSDGENIYHRSLMERGKGMVTYIVPGNPARIEESPTVSLLWLACCAGTVLKNESGGMLQSLWTDSGVLRDNDRRVECLLPVKFKRGVLASGCLERIEFLNDGRRDMCNPAHSVTNGFPPPCDTGFTQCVYRVEHTVSIPDGPTLPAAFVIELFAPTWQKEGDSLVFKGFKVRMKLSGEVTNAALVAAPTSWLPQLPNERVLVEDYRPKVFYGGGPDHLYATNAWPRLTRYRQLKSSSISE